MKESTLHIDKAYAQSTRELINERQVLRRQSILEKGKAFSSLLIGITRRGENDFFPLVFTANHPISSPKSALVMRHFAQRMLKMGPVVSFNSSKFHTHNDLYRRISNYRV